MLRINPRSSTPIPLQITSSFRELIANGRLRPGDRVPTVGELSEKFFLNPDQVKLAYKQLIKEGIFETGVDGKETVTEKAASITGRMLVHVVEELLESIKEAREAGIDWNDLKALILWLKEQESKATDQQKETLPEILKKIYFDSPLHTTGTPNCPYCREQIVDEGIVRCATCKTPYHQECWHETHHCSVFGCTGKIAFPV